MKKYYTIMGALALDYYMEEKHPELDMDDKISLLIMDKADYIANKIAQVINKTCELNPTISKDIDDLFLNEVADYFYHFMFLEDVSDLDEEMDSFIKLSYGLAGDLSISNIIQEVIRDSK